jgi:hypothetical protein
MFVTGIKSDDVASSVLSSHQLVFKVCLVFVYSYHKDGGGNVTGPGQ